MIFRKIFYSSIFVFASIKFANTVVSDIIELHKINNIRKIKKTREINNIYKKEEEVWMLLELL